MKYLIFIFAPFFLFCTSKTVSIAKILNTDSTTQAKSDTLKIDCAIPDLSNIIVRNDTTFDYRKFKGHAIESYDSKNRLRRREITNLYENNSKNIFSEIEIYDTVGHKVYESKTRGLVCWHCFKYSYDKAGHLINKSGYSSGEIGINVSCY
jgi:hypothetical protein